MRIKVTLVGGNKLTIICDDCKTVKKIRLNNNYYDFDMDTSNCEDFIQLRRLVKSQIEDSMYGELCRKAASKGYDIESVGLRVGPTEDVKFNVLYNYEDLWRELNNGDCLWTNNIK